MPLFRRRPADVEAMRYPGAEDVEPAEAEAFRAWLAARDPEQRHRLVHDALVIPPRGGGSDMVAERGDWIVQGPGGGLYPVKPADFAATYEAAEGAPPAA